MRIGLPSWLRQRKCDGAMPIGLDLGDDVLSMVQCASEGGTAIIQAATEIPYGCSRGEALTDKRILAKVIKQGLGNAPFKGRRVHTSLRADEVKIVPLSITNPGNQGEAAAVIKALKEKLRSDLADDIVDYLPVRQGKNGVSDTTVLAAVANRAVVWNHLRMLEATGLTPLSLDIGPAALARLLVRLQAGDQEDAALLLNFGREKSYITAVSGRRLMLDREMMLGEQTVISTLTSALSVDEEAAAQLLNENSDQNSGAYGSLVNSTSRSILDEVLYSLFSLLTEEVSRTLVYISSNTRGGSVKTIFINGNLARYPYFRSRLENLFNVPVALLDPLRQFQPASSHSFDTRLAPSAGIALAAGLSMRG